MSKPKVRPKLKTYAIISEAVEQGISYGYQRSFKYSETPSKEHIIETIRAAVMSSLGNVVNLDDR